MDDGLYVLQALIWLPVTQISKDVFGVGIEIIRDAFVSKRIQAVHDKYRVAALSQRVYNM
jgi:hypothetical protein